MGIFKRNLTSEILEEQASKIISEFKTPISILEVGCGDGNISRNLAQKFPDNFFHASDISEESIAYAKNKNTNNIIDFKVSKGIDEWIDKKFKVIICDISAISEKIADLSDWYNGVSCNTGINGLDVVGPVIENVKNIMSKDSFFIIPIISLCNVELQKKSLYETFYSVEYSKKRKWPLPKDLLINIHKESINLDSDFLDIEEKFGMVIAYTCAAICNNAEG